MTPEERFSYIEALLQSTAERQARQAEEIEKQNEAIRGLIQASASSRRDIEEQNEAIRGLIQASASSRRDIEEQNEAIRGLIQASASSRRDIDTHNEAIKSLIVVARTLLDSVQGFREDHDRFMREMDKLKETQTGTEEKLNALIDIVDRIIRRRNGKEQL